MEALVGGLAWGSHERARRERQDDGGNDSRMKSVREMSALQDGLPPGGASLLYATPAIFLARGPDVVAFFLTSFGIISYGMYQVGQGNRYRSQLKREKLVACSAIVPLLQAEEDESEMLAESPTQTIVVGRLGGGWTVVTANPANVEHILRTQFQNYPKGEPFTAIMHDLLGRGIFNADEDGWKMQSRVTSYECNTRSLRSSIVLAMEEVTDRLLPLLQEASEMGRCLDLQDVLQRFAFDNICKVVKVSLAVQE
ncbi:hypothetical protein SUGI_1072160 [Cryptomeria japonica]|nr:hypothetical protein SUGI_1072160 [Cryptomeria japonica]